MNEPVLALDLGASRIRAAVVRPDGTLAARADGPTRLAEGPAVVVGDSIALLRRVLADAPDDLATAVTSIGISAPGPVDPFRGRLVEPPNMGPAFRDAAFAEPIAAALDREAWLDRDTHVALLGELGFGAAKGARHALYITISTGLGGAILSDGRLVTGPDGVAGELGHLVVDLDGPTCNCGERGHLEAFSSGVAIARAAREAVEQGSAPGLSAAAERQAPAPLTARDIAALEEAGDRDAAAIMATARDAFAAAMVSFVDLFAPELIVIGGSLARGQGDRWLDPAREAVRTRAFRVPAARVRIVPAALGDDVGLVGGLELVRHRRADRDAAAG